MTKRLRTLLFSTLFPNSVLPGHGIFVETRLRQLLASGEIDVKVVAPVPWFPSTNPRFGSYAQWARVPKRETRNGIDVLHPRYALPPKIGMNIAPFTLALSAVPTIRRLIREGYDFDAIDAHYYYPDGVAAALLAKWFDKPFSVTARGSDLTQIADYPIPRKLMQWTAHRADASIGVCAALVDLLRPWGVDPSRLHVFRNGVDLQRFHPLPPDECRHALGIAGAPVIVSCGYLIERKGHHFIIDALALLAPQYPAMRLVIIGDGPDHAALVARAKAAGVESRVTFAGRVDNAELKRWYSAADALVLASSREGWANVLLEAMACGTPAVSTRAGGSPEVVAAPEAGQLIDERTAEGIARGIATLLARQPDRRDVRAYAEGFSWDATTQAQLRLFSGMASAEG